MKFFYSPFCVLFGRNEGQMHYGQTLSGASQNLGKTGIASFFPAITLAAAAMLFSTCLLAYPPIRLLMVDAGADVNLCLGDTAKLVATGANSYTWSPAAGLSCTDCPNPLAFPTSTTLYVVTADDGSVDSVLVSVFPPPTLVSVQSANPTDCNLPNGVIVINASGDSLLEYSVSGGLSWSVSNVFTALPSGIYQVMVRNVGGACPVTGASVTLAAPSAPQILNVLSFNPTLCDVPNGSIVISTSGGVIPLQYSIDGGQTWQAQNTFQILGSGTYQIRVRNSNGSCVVNGGTVVLTGSPNEAFISSIFTAGPTTCDTSDGLITVLVSNDDGNFEYSVDGGLTFQSSNAFSGLDEGMYHIIVRRTDGTCTTSGGYAELESQNRPEIFGASVVQPQGCGAANGNITILASGTSTIEFSVNGGGNFQASNIFADLPAGNYQLAVRNVDGSCMTLGENVTLTAPQAPVITGVSFTNPTACGVSDGSITIAASPSGTGIGLEYSINGGANWSPSNIFTGLSEGNYTVVARAMGSSCLTNYSLNPVPLDAPGTPPVVDNILISNPTGCFSGDGSLTIQASGIGSFLFSINGGTNFQGSNVFQNLAAGDYSILVITQGGNCTANGSATLVNTGVCADTIQVTIPANTQTVSCLDPSVFDIQGNITAAGFCSQGTAATVFASLVNQACVTLVPANGFTGVSPDVICLVHCFNGSASACDTTYLIVTVEGQVNCPDVFGVDVMTVPFLGDPTPVCIPVSPTIISPYDLSLNGLSLATTPGCDFDSVLVYTYTILPNQGFSGPYSLDAWTVGNTTFSGFFNNVNELLDLMNILDPAGDWEIDGATGVIFSSNLAGGYGNMSITHVPTATQLVLMTNLSIVPNGFLIHLTSPDLHVLVADDPAGSCADTLLINVTQTPPQLDTVYLTTTVNQATQPFCLTSADFPGNATVEIIGYCGDALHGNLPIVGDSCVMYVPQQGFVGLDTFCMVACGGAVQVCDSTIFFVTVLPELDTVFLTILAGGTQADTCLTNTTIELPAGVAQGSFCQINQAEITGDIAGNCLTFNVVGSFSGQTQACVVFCNGGFCDTTIVVIQVTPPIPCLPIFAQNTYSLTSPVDSAAFCLPISTGNVVNYEVLVDGTPWAQPFVPCTGNGSQIVIHGFGQHQVIVIDQNNCVDTATVNLFKHLVSTEIIHVTTPQNTPVNLCGNLGELLGDFFSQNICGFPGNGSVSIANDSCLTYAPAFGFTGSDTLCMVVCDDNLPGVPGGQVCDTFIFIVNVPIPCPVIFNPDLLTVPLENGVGEVCLDIPLEDIGAYEIGVDGSPYSLPLGGCNFDSVFNYYYGFVFGGGNQGPYQATWVVNGNSFNGTVSDIAGLVLFMNNNDPAGNWTQNAASFTLNSSNQDGSYGSLTLFHPASNTTSNLLANLFAVPLGTLVKVSGAGSHEVVLTDTSTGCTDTLFVNAEEPPPPPSDVDTIFLQTLTDVPTQIACLDTTDLPGNFVAIGICGQPQNGVIISDLACFTFNPINGFNGSDSACLTVCDDLGNCDTTLVFITVSASFDSCTAYQTIFPDGLQTVELTTCADSAAWCAGVLFDSLAQFGFLDNGFPYAGSLIACLPSNAQLMLDTGLHEVIAVHLNSGCADTLLLDVTCQPDTTTGCGITAVSPMPMALLDCDSSAQLCLSVLLADFQNIVVFDNGTDATGSIEPCDLDALFASISLDTGAHQLIFEDTLKGCTDTLDVAVLCAFLDDTAIDTALQVTEDVMICLADLGYDVSLIDSVENVCTGTGNVIFSVDTLDWCITLTGLDIGLDTACFHVYLLGDSALVTIVAEVGEPCPSLLPDTLGAAAMNCDTGLICLPFTADQIQNLQIEVDGVPFTDTLQACSFDSVFVLSYSALPSQGLIGPYLIDNWTIGGSAFTGQFDSSQQLADLMSLWDPFGDWSVFTEPGSGLVFIVGGGAGGNYGSMAIEQDLTNMKDTLEIGGLLEPTGFGLPLPPGVFEVTVMDTASQCTEILIAIVACVTSEIFTDTIEVGDSDTLCLDMGDLVGEVTSLSNACPGSGNPVAFVVLDSCLIYEGFDTGTDSACIVVCDDYGICDTTYVFITVLLSDDSTLIAVNDTTVTGQGLSRIIPVFDNDLITSLDTFYILDEALHGNANFLPTGQVNYVPDQGYCDSNVPDQFSYVICNENGCDTATVFVTVECDSLEIFTGFSPNGDGVNDFFKINGLNKHPNHHLWVYNRWGNLVFEVIEYQNDWEGTWNGKILPDGTYYYVLDLGDGDGVLKGYVQLHR